MAQAAETWDYCHLGILDCAHADPGSEFESSLFPQLSEVWREVESHTTPYHPWANGVVERGSKDLGDVLRAMLPGGNDGGDIKLPHIMKSIRAMLHNSTGETSSFLMLGRSCASLTQ